MLILLSQLLSLHWLWKWCLLPEFPGDMWIWEKRMMKTWMLGGRILSLLLPKMLVTKGKSRYLLPLKGQMMRMPRKRVLFSIGRREEEPRLARLPELREYPDPGDVFLARMNSLLRTVS
jgi:hypothetical protein